MSTKLTDIVLRELDETSTGNKGHVLILKMNHSSLITTFQFEDIVFDNGCDGKELAKKLRGLADSLESNYN